MKQYCLIKNNQIVTGPESLPETWRNISNFYALDNITLKRYGWLPYEVVSENKQIIVSSTRQILVDKVVETIITRDKNLEEIQQEEQTMLQNKWLEVRNTRNELLKESDIYVLADRWSSMNPNQQQQWSQYREALRNIPQTFTNPNEVIFPIKPF
jgi:hypothetical protein